jgi:hypothetical protein
MQTMIFQRVIQAMAIAAIVGAPAAVRAQDPAKGASLLADARKAIGGEDKVAAVKRLQANGSFKRAAGNNTLEGDFEIFIEAPDKYRVTEETGVAGGPTAERTQVLNGTDVWDDNSGGGFPAGGFRGGRGGDFGGGGGRGGFGGGRGRVGDAGNGADAQPGGGRQGLDPERVKELQRRQRQADLSRYLLAWVLMTDQPVTWIGTAQSPDGTADVLEVAAPQGGTATRLFLDTKTHLPLMLTWEGGGGGRFGGGRGGRRGDGAAAPAPGAAATPPQAPTNEMHLAEYKTVNGLKLPTLITRSINGQTTEEMTVKNYKINPTFKASTFTK